MAGKQSATALRWVERLLEPSASEEMMTKAAQVFSPDHYSDVVEERNIGSLCGYPPCSNPLGPQPRQKYHISLAKKKIFDLTQRKKFCSVECYQASNYYASQLSTSPLTARDGTSIVINFLPHTGSKTEPAKQVKADTPLASSSSSDSQLVIKEVSVEEAASRLGGLNMVEDEPNEAEPRDDEPEGNVELRDSSTAVAHPKLSPVGRLLHAMSSWCTPDTWHFVNQESGKERHTVEQAASVRDECSPEESYKLKCDQEKGGSSRETEREGTQTREGDEGTERTSVLPLVHSLAHSQLQRTIFVQQLKKNILSVAAELSLSVDEVLPRLLPLVWTFRFSRHTVMFKPTEWKVILLVLIHIVAPEWKTVSKPTSQEWLRAVKATDIDMNLMLNTFTHE